MALCAEQNKQKKRHSENILFGEKINWLHHAERYSSASPDQEQEIHTHQLCLT